MCTLQSRVFIGATIYRQTYESSDLWSGTCKICVVAIFRFSSFIASKISFHHRQTLIERKWKILMKIQSFSLKCNQKCDVEKNGGRRSVNSRLNVLKQNFEENQILRTWRLLNSILCATHSLVQSAARKIVTHNLNDSHKENGFWNRVSRTSLFFVRKISECILFFFCSADWTQKIVYNWRILSMACLKKLKVNLASLSLFLWFLFFELLVAYKKKQTRVTRKSNR